MREFSGREIALGVLVCALVLQLTQRVPRDDLSRETAPDPRDIAEAGCSDGTARRMNGASEEQSLGEASNPCDNRTSSSQRRPPSFPHDERLLFDSRVVLEPKTYVDGP